MPKSLNPYCNGRKNRIINGKITGEGQLLAVLILIVMEERIGYLNYVCYLHKAGVLILILMEERIGSPKDLGVKINGDPS